MKRLIRFVQALATTLRSDSKCPRLFDRILRASVFIPVFSALLLLLRLQLLMGKSVTLEAVTTFETRIRCHLPDLIQMYILLFKCWEPDLTLFLGERLKPGDTFIDVGANVGYFSLLAAQKVGENGSVVAIEALPENFAELQNNLIINGASGTVRAINQAVSDTVGVIKIYAGPAHNVGLASTAPERQKKLQLATSIPAAPISALLSPEEIRCARILKIDVEGGEVEVLAGIESFLELCSPQLEIFLELSPSWWSDKSLTPEMLLAPLRAAGFNTFLIENNYWPWRYLWPNAVKRPQRVHRLPENRVKRIDLILSKIDSDYL